MTLFGPEQMASNRLQAHKSSFQAWKCVSFGCSLLAIVLLLSKWHEVTTDLQMLLGIDRLLIAQATSTGGSNGSSNNGNSDNSNNNSNSSSTESAMGNPLSWPPVPLDQLLPAANESSFGMESMANNETMLMSHMHMSLNRELSGNQLLRQEVDAFIAEFRNAKSTLSLSTLLVSVYIISWILMTLAINDTRISIPADNNDAEPESVKNSPFASELLGSSGLKDTPVRLSADQLTAFTALRLIAMRSCSAYVDVFVSVVIGLLTILRLHAILRALTYYRRLRRLTELHQHQSMDESAAEHKQIWSSSFYDAQNGRGLFATTARHLISPNAHHHQQQQQQQQHHSQEQTHSATGPLAGYSRDQSFRLTPIMDPSGSARQVLYQAVHHAGQQRQHQQQQNTLPLQARYSAGASFAGGQFLLQQQHQQQERQQKQQQQQQQQHESGSSVPIYTSKLTTVKAALSPASPRRQTGEVAAEQSPMVLMFEQRALAPQQGGRENKAARTTTSGRQKTTTNRNNADSPLLLLPQHLQQLPLAGSLQRLVRLPRRHQLYSRATRPDSSAARHTNSLLVSSRRELRQQVEREAEYESEPLAFRVGLAKRSAESTGLGADQQEFQFLAPETSAVDEEDNCDQLIEDEQSLARESSQQNLLAAAEPIAVSPQAQLVAGRTVCSASGATYTLLSASQLDQLSRKLTVAPTTIENGDDRKSAPSSTSAKQQQYRLAVEVSPPQYRQSGLVAENPTYGTSTGATLACSALKQHRRIMNSIDDRSSNSSLYADDDSEYDYNDLSAVSASARLPVAASRAGKGRRQATAARLTGVRQTEELVADSMRQKVFAVSDKNGHQNFLLGKYYYA